MSTLTFPDNFRVFVNDPPQGYPISGLTWMLIYKHYGTQAQVDGVKKMVKWVLTDGQKINNSLQYTQIPAPVVQRALSAVDSEVTVGQ